MKYETKWRLLTGALLGAGATLVILGFGCAGGVGLLAFTLYLKLGSLED